MGTFPVAYTSLPSGASPGSHILDQTNYEAIRTALRADSANRNAGGFNYASIGDLFVNRIFSVSGGQRVRFADSHAFLSQAQGASATQGQFAVSSPGGTIAGGGATTTTITLAPVPPGINGTDVNHLVYISGGTGTAEAVLITGGTAVAEAASGTITVVAANAHSGAWKIGSATGGLAEALQSVASAGVAGVVSMMGDIATHAQISIPATGTYWLEGTGVAGAKLSRAADYADGTILTTTPGSSANVTIQNMNLNSGNAGHASAGLVIDAASGTFVMTNTAVTNGKIGIQMKQWGSVVLDKLQVGLYDTSFTPFACIWVGGQATTGSSNVLISNSVFVSPHSAQVASYAMLIDTVDGLTMTNCWLGADVGLAFRSVSAPLYITNIQIDNCIMDGCATSAVRFQTAAAAVDGIKFTGCHLHGQGLGGSTYGQGPSLDITSGSTADNLHFIGCHFRGSHVSGVLISRTGGTNIVFSGGDATDNGLTSGNGITLAAGVAGVTINGMRARGASQSYGISLQGAISNCCMVGNNLGGNASNAIGTNPATPITGSVIKSNTGVDDVLYALGTSSTLTVPINPHFLLVGAGSVTAVVVNQICPGASGTFRSNATVTFTTGGGIGNSGTASAGKLYVWVYDGTSFWISGSGF